MEAQHRSWLKATAAVVGATALTLGGVALPAAAVETSPEAAPVAVDVDKYEIAAETAGASVETVKQLENEGTILVSDLGFVVHLDPAHTSAHSLEGLDLPAAPESAPIPGDPSNGSRPGAPVTIYLDFDGETLTNTFWNEEEGEDTLVFAPAAHANATFRDQVWAAVAEDWAPFNVNVTTTRPSDADLYKSDANDERFGSHVIITDSYTDVASFAAGTGGIALLGGAGSFFLSGAFVFTVGTGGGNAADASARSVADNASHEAAHNFGLSHHGIAGGGEYYSPTEGVWGPIMGTTYRVPLSQWTDGSFAGATNAGQADLAVITDQNAPKQMFIGFVYEDNGATYTRNTICVEGNADPMNPQPGDRFREPTASNQCDGSGRIVLPEFTYTGRATLAADQVGNTPATAASLDNTGGSFTVDGVIETSSDVDVYKFTTLGGAVSASVEVAQYGPNLNAKLTLSDASGAVLDENSPAPTRVSESVAGNLGASVSANVPAGTYYLAVEGVGAGNPANATPTNAGGFSDYGSLGNFTLSGDAPEFVTDPIVITAPADGTAVDHGDSVAVTGTATPGASVTLTVGGTVVGTATADASGNWSADVTVNRYGNTEIVASQNVNGIDVAGTDSVTVTVAVAAPVIEVPTDGDTVENKTPAVSGTGIPGATVTVTVVVNGAPVTATATVTAQGTWQLTLPALADGDYEISATQAINGVTSPVSNEVGFTVKAPAGGGDGGNDGNGNGNGNGGDNGNDGDLAHSGSANVFGPLAGLGAGLLIVAAGLMLVANRRKESLES